MDSKYSVFLKVLDCGSFTRAAEELGYSQSAVSQSVRTLENELGTKLILRSREGLALTEDGKSYLPFLRAVAASENALADKKTEMLGLSHSKIRIGTFTSISRNILPRLMQEFLEIYPDVTFELIQGDYTTITEDILTGSLDFGFVNPESVSDIITESIYQDSMMAVLPADHPLAENQSVSLKDLVHDPFIVLDEGNFSIPLQEFEKHGLMPNITYKVTDDYTILSMIRQGLGISILYKLVLSGFSDGVRVLPIDEKFNRTIAVGYRDYETMPIAARRFVDFIKEKLRDVLPEAEYR